MSETTLALVDSADFPYLVNMANYLEQKFVPDIEKISLWSWEKIVLK